MSGAKLVPPEEPLAESAPLARRLAPTLCRKDPATAESCAWYHGFWQYARLMGLGTSADLHADFFYEAFAAIPAISLEPRILIAGAADYSMLAVVLAACRVAGVRADITVVDRCETPLMLNRWYAERASQTIATICADLTAHTEERRYDLLCTHALLGHLNPARRRDLLARWRDLLRPGGLAITVNRLRPGAGGELAAFGPEQVNAYREAVRRRARSLPNALAADPDELARDAERYAQRQVMWPLRSLQEIRDVFESSGFSLDHLSCAPLSARAEHTGLSVPTVPGGAEYARIIARRV